MSNSNKHDPIYSPILLLLGPIFLFLRGKKIVLPCLDVTMIAFSRKIYSEVLFLPETAPVNSDRMPPVHPIILLKSN